MKQSIRGLTAVVTGASRGIGRATALSLAEQGARLGLIARSGEALDLLAGEICANGGEAHPLTVDLGNIAGIPAAVATMIGALGKIDVLVNNAGTFHESAFADMKVEDLERTLRVNLTAPFVLTRELLPKIKAVRGRVVNIVSSSGMQGYEHQSAYCASKHGLLGLMRALALEVKRDGVHVHNLCPGGVDTDFIKGTKLGERLAGQTMIAPEDIAEMVVFLLKQPPHIDLPEMVLRRFSK